MAERNWGELLREHAPDLDAQNRSDLEFLDRATALSSREKLLMAMVLDAAATKPIGARNYGEQAVRAGASRDEVLDALRVLRMFAGRPALATGCEALRQFEKP
jgi:alkylhydroperoxidase/carboxymuconolactone decarboxylase family protein YurZ